LKLLDLLHSCWNSRLGLSPVLVGSHVLLVNLLLVESDIGNVHVGYSLIGELLHVLDSCRLNSVALNWY
jgi:hypothetical protein